MFYVLLTCSETELKHRIILEERKKCRKADTVEMMEMFLEKYNLCSPVPYTDTVVIDNTELPPENVAEQIISHYGLPKSRQGLKSG